MNRPRFSRLVGLSVLLSLLWLAPALAQRTLGTQTLVPSSQALGMGGTAVAYPSARTALFYNPAQLTRLHVTRVPITMLGLSASISNNTREQLAFYRDRIDPVLADGLSNLSAEEEQALYDEIFELAGSPTVLGGDVLLPSFVMNNGALGFGGGVFVHAEAAYNVEDAGAGVPGMDFTALADFMAVASGAADLGAVGLPGLSAGVTAKYAQRYLSLKYKPFDAIDDDESLYVLGASTLAFDVGLLYEADLGIPGRLYLGAVASDLALRDFDYRFSAYYVRNEEARKDAAIAAEAALARERYQLQSSIRAGVAYVLPVLAGPLKETVVALDYVGYDDPTGETPLLGHLSLGVQTKVASMLSLRTGLNQGYTSVGAGLQLPFARLDYTFHGSEMGRLPGQSPSWHHRVALSLGSF